jgi:hypothetical protein
MESEFPLISGAVSLLTPQAIDVFNYYIGNKIQSEQARKSAIFIAQLVVGFAVAFLVNIIGSFEAPIFYVFLIGTGINLPAGMAAYRARKLKNSTPNGGSIDG